LVVLEFELGASCLQGRRSRLESLIADLAVL
jgi:hypothetical protein